MELTKRHDALTSTFEKKDVWALEEKIDAAERDGRERFAYFTDLDVIHWFLYAEEALDASDERSERTTREYEMELTQFVTNMLTYGDAIGLDLDPDVARESLFQAFDVRHVRRYQRWLKEESPFVQKNGSYAKATLARKTNILSHFFSSLYEARYITRPLHHGLKRASMRADDRPNRDLHTSDVIQLLDTFRAIDHPVMYAIVQTLVTTGMRNEELCRLMIGDVKQWAHDPYVRVTGKGNKRRDIPLKPSTCRAIDACRAVRGMAPVASSDPEEPLFVTSRGRAYSPSYLAQYVKKEIERIRPLLSLETEAVLTPHVFRHAFAIISHEQGVDVFDIMRSLGHEKIETTMIYLQKVFERERHASTQWKTTANGHWT